MDKVSWANVGFKNATFSVLSESFDYRRHVLPELLYFLPIKLAKGGKPLVSSADFRRKMAT